MFMNLIIYFFTGFIAAIIGAVPLGATNIMIINTTIRENIQIASKIIYTAGIAELILVIAALNFSTPIERFIGMNVWIQYSIVVILLVIGTVLVTGSKKECYPHKNDPVIDLKKRTFSIPKQLQGFILGLINPPVLIYWILVVSFLSNKTSYLPSNIEFIILSFFLAGVFIGKILTLHGYGRFSHVLKQRIKNITTTINTVIGTLLIIVAIFQFTKLFYF